MFMYNNRLISKLWCNVPVKTTVVVLIIIGIIAVLSSISDSTATTLVEAATHPLPSPYGSTNRNPYQILGVPITATPKEIKRQYYKLCLKYHPDKQSSHLSLKQRQRNEQLFKHIQWAYSEVVRSPSSESWHNKDGGAYYGNRWKDDISRSSFANSFRSYLHRNSAADNAWKRPSQQGTSSSTNGPSPSLFDHWNPYGNNPHGGLYRSSTSPSFFGRTNPSFVWKNQHQSRMLFVQHVTIPLQELYRGTTQYEFHLHDVSIVSHVVAAFRGGIGQALLYQSLLYSLPLMRFSKLLSVGLCIFLFCQHLPPRIPTTVTKKRSFRADILPGYKTNTKFIFHEEQTHLNNVEIQFIIREGQHPLYKRVGSELHVTATVSSRQAAKGCTTYIPSLRTDHSRTSDDTEPQYITVRIPPRTVSGDNVRIDGQGWPIRNPKRPTQPISYGDLIVTVQVVPKSKNRAFFSRRHYR
jgi:DnaJ-class molecular chaperone